MAVARTSRILDKSHSPLNRALFRVRSKHEKNDYNETRFVAYSMLDKRLHVVCFTETQAGIRVISFRKANSREVKRYEQETLNR